MIFHTLKTLENTNIKERNFSSCMYLLRKHANLKKKKMNLRSNPQNTLLK